MKIRNAVLSALLGASTFAAFAQTPAAAGVSTPVVDARQQRQEQRIEQGKASGQLTPREALQLEREQQHIARAEARAKADGQVTKAERERLHQRQGDASRHIHQQKHDRHHRPAPAVSAVK